MWNVVKRTLLWNYPRASWQYDIMVAVIVLFVLLTPRAWFHDQPRIPQSHEVVLLPSPKGTSVFWLDPELLSSLPADAPDSVLRARAAEVLKNKTITSVEREYNSEHELTGYMAAAKP